MMEDDRKKGERRNRGRIHQGREREIYQPVLPSSL
jgi:hypothetical protein